MPLPQAKSKRPQEGILRALRVHLRENGSGRAQPSWTLSSPLALEAAA